MAYIYLLTKEQLEQEKRFNLEERDFHVLNQIEYKESRRKAQSILRFIRKGILLNNGSWSISFSKIHKDYNDWVNKKKKKRPELKNISLKQIKNIVNKLKDLGLLIIENVKKRNCYFLPLPNKLPNNENITMTDITSIECNQVTPRYIRNNNIDIDSNSNSKEFNADMYEKCTSLVDVRNKVKELLKAARVKSSWIKNKVLTKLSENYRNITVKFLESYINTVIENTRNTYYSNYRKYIKNNTNNRVLPNFTERNYSKDYWEYIEKFIICN